MRHHRRAPLVTARTALTDTTAFFALMYPRESHHVESEAIARRLHAERWQLFTTNFIRAETHALVLNRLGHQMADRALHQIGQGSPTTIVRVTEQDEVHALALIAKYQDKDFTLTDATSFVVVERLGITHAFTFDDDFRQYGWLVLQP